MVEQGSGVSVGTRHGHGLCSRWFGALALVCAVAPACADHAVQVGAFRYANNVDATVQLLKASGFPVITRRAVLPDGSAVIQVLVGPFVQRGQAEIALRALRNKQWPGFIRDDVDGVGATAKTRPIVPNTAPILGAGPNESGKGVGQLFAPPPAAPAPNAAASLFAPPPAVPAPVSGLPTQSSGIGWSGFYLFEGAYTTPEPAHGSKLRNTLEVEAHGAWTPNVRWKFSARGWYDAIYDVSDFYSNAVRDDQRTELMLRDTYVDMSVGDWDLRLGRQQIVWGEMVGVFVADVVSAKDQREFILPDFDFLRLPQWAARAEYFKGDFHAEGIWIPYMTYDNIGVPGSNFYPYPPPPPTGTAMVINPDTRPPNTLSNSAYGLRLSYLFSGWDTSLLYYKSMDAAPTFFRQIVPGAVIYTPEHVPISQTGMTVSKDFQQFVLRAEAVYTQGEMFSVTRLTEPNGVVRQNHLNYAAGVDFPLPHDWHLNAQFYQQRFFEHDPDTLFEAVESGVSMLVSTKLYDQRIEPQLLVIWGLTDQDNLIRPRVAWTINKNRRRLLQWPTVQLPGALPESGPDLYRSAL
jgi:hypothetical protein